MTPEQKRLILNDMLYRQRYKRGCSFDIGEPDYDDIIGFLEKELKVLPWIDHAWIYAQIEFIHKIENASIDKQTEYFNSLKEHTINYKY